MSVTLSSDSGIGRLFFAESLDLDSPSGRRRCLEKILEEGDSSDLRRVLPQIGEPETIAWLEQHGGRRLSRRNRKFWAFVLSCAEPDPHPITNDIWPL